MEPIIIQKYRAFACPFRMHSVAQIIVLLHAYTSQCLLDGHPRHFDHDGVKEMVACAWNSSTIRRVFHTYVGFNFAVGARPENPGGAAHRD